MEIKEIIDKILTYSKKNSNFDSFAEFTEVNFREPIGYLDNKVDNCYSINFILPPSILSNIYNNVINCNYKIVKSNFIRIRMRNAGNENQFYTQEIKLENNLNNYTYNKILDVSDDILLEQIYTNGENIDNKIEMHMCQKRQLKIIPDKKKIKQKSVTFHIIQLSVQFFKINVIYEICFMLNKENENKPLLFKTLNNLQSLFANTKSILKIEYYDFSNEETFTSELLKIFKCVFNIQKIHNISLNFDPKILLLKTNVIFPRDLFSIDEKITYITEKIDGIPLNFITDTTGKCKLFFPLFDIHIQSNLKVNSYGCGEFITVNKKRYIYPFYFKNLDDLSEDSNRIEFLIKYSELIEKTSEDNVDLIFKTKTLIGPFENKKEMVKNILSLF